MKRHIPKRPNKVATGMTKNNLRQNKKRSLENPHDVDILYLSVRGTLDSLRSINRLCELVEIPHPLDPSFTKLVYRLTDRGRVILRIKRPRRLSKR
jgi:hypothetical protein